MYACVECVCIHECVCVWGGCRCVRSVRVHVGACVWVCGCGPAGVYMCVGHARAWRGWICECVGANVSRS